MARFARAAAALSAAGVALSLTAAAAGTTTVREGTADGAPYAGSVTGTLISDTARFTSSFATVDCTDSALSGTVDSDGTDLAVDDADWSGCRNSLGGTTTVTALDLPWSGGSVVHAPLAGGRDGTMTMSGTLARVDSEDGFGNVTTCYYQGGGRGGSMTGDVYNRDNPARPEPDDDAQGRADAVELALVDTAAHDSDSVCGSTAAFTATYALRGAGGTKLYLTP